jgi:hypothetical protein
VQALERRSRDADVGGVGESSRPVRNTFTAAASERRRRQVERRQRDQVPERVDRVGRLAVRAEPVAEAWPSSAGRRVEPSAARAPRATAAARSPERERA